MRQIVSYDKRQGDDTLRRGVRQELVVALRRNVDQLVRRHGPRDGRTQMPEPILRRQTSSIVVAGAADVVDVVVDPHEPTGCDDEGFVVRIEEPTEVVEALLHRQNDAVQHNGIILNKIKSS